MNAPTQASLRQRQKAATRELILEIGMEILLDPGASFSHEAIAEGAGMSARTVYRHFPTQADLFRALWQRHRETTGTRFPLSEAEVLPLTRTQFRLFEEHAPLVEALLSLPMRAEILKHGWEEGHAALQRALAGIADTLPAAEARWLVAVCQSIYSAPFWQMLRTRGQLSGEEAGDAAAWAMEAVLNAARSRMQAAQSVSADVGEKVRPTSRRPRHVG